MYTMATSGVGGTLGLPILPCQADYEIQAGLSVSGSCWAAFAACIGPIPFGCATVIPLCSLSDAIALYFDNNNPLAASVGCWNTESIATPVYSAEAAHNHWCNCGWRGCSWGCADNHGATYISSYTYHTAEVLKTGSSRYEGTLHNYGYNMPGTGCNVNAAGSTTPQYSCATQCDDDGSYFTSTNSWNPPTCAADGSAYASSCAGWKDYYCPWHTWVQEQCPTTCCGMF
ncbi:hypothetical protein ScalyP_jg5733 [Parmales sp. scaly parma]|nr:hypothetical protein ScalyP_jg5733 [Parmales sp. scaly parma]